MAAVVTNTREILVGATRFRATQMGGNEPVGRVTWKI